MKNDQLIENMQRSGYLNTPRIRGAFLNVDRKNFVESENEAEAYGDYPLPIGQGQTISQPSTVAFMLEKIEPKPGDKILDVGSGSGWTTALLAYIVGDKGRVFGVEKLPDLVVFGQNNLAKYNFKNASISQASNKLGLEDKAPFDKILVSAAAQKLHQELVAQLKPNGRLVMPIKNSIHVIIKNDEGEVDQQEFPGFVFVPLV